MSFQNWALDPRFKNLSLLALILLVSALGAYTYLTLKQSWYLYSGPTTISVEGEGEVIARPDIATFTFSVESSEILAEDAQARAAEDMNAIMAYLEKSGIEEKDIKTTSYNLYPEYQFIESICQPGFCEPSKRELVGYRVSQSVSVKVRAIDEAGSFIAGVGERGASNISGLRFTIDDEDALKAAARDEAIKNAREKAQGIAKGLDARIGRVVGFWEDGGDQFRFEQAEFGFGGSVDSAVKSAPSLSVGENTITSRVNVTYELK